MIHRTTIRKRNLELKYVILEQRWKFKDKNPISHDPTQCFQGLVWMNSGFDKTKIQKLIQRYRGRSLHRGGYKWKVCDRDLYLQIGQMSETSGGVIVIRRGGKDNFPSVIKGPSIQLYSMYLITNVNAWTKLMHSLLYFYTSSKFVIDISFS